MGRAARIKKGSRKVFFLERGEHLQLETVPNSRNAGHLKGSTTAADYHIDPSGRFPELFNGARAFFAQFTQEASLNALLGNGGTVPES